MLASMRKSTEQHFATVIQVGSARLAQKISEDEISTKDLAVTLGIVSDKLARWHGWEKGMGGASGEAGDLLYKIFGGAADGKLKASLTVEPVDQSVIPEREQRSGGDVVEPVTSSDSLVIEAKASAKADSVDADPSGDVR
jgi:hypothetical protein